MTHEAFDDLRSAEYKFNDLLQSWRFTFGTMQNADLYCNFCIARLPPYMSGFLICTGPVYGVDGVARAALML